MAVNSMAATPVAVILGPISPIHDKKHFVGNKIMWKSTFPMHCNVWLLDISYTTSRHLDYGIDEAF